MTAKKAAPKKADPGKAVAVRADAPVKVASERVDKGAVERRASGPMKAALPTHDIQTTMRPWVTITVSDDEYQSLLTRGLVYSGNPVAPVADGYDLLFANEVANGVATPPALATAVSGSGPVGTALRAAFDARYSPVASPQIAFGEQVLYAPKHLRRAQAKLAESQNRLCHIAVTGDSVSLGAYADNAATGGDDTVFRRKGWVGYLRRLLGQRYGYPGEGILFPQGVGPSVPYTYQVSGGGAYTGVSQAGATGQTVGLFGRSFTIGSAGQALTATVKADPDAPAGSKMAIRLGLWTAGGSTAPTLSIDGGTAAPITGFSTAATEVSQEITLATGLDPTVDHTVSLVGAASPRPMWLSSYIQPNGTSTVPSKGIALHRMAESGTVLADALAYGANPGAWPASNYDRQLATSFDPVSPDLIVLAHNVNNLTRGRTVWNYTPADVQANTQRVVDKLVAKGYDVLLVNPDTRNPATYSDNLYTQDDFSAALAAVATGTDFCAFLDVGKAWGAFADASGNGLYAPDPNGAGVHPNSRGHAYIARIVAGALGL